MKSHNVFERLEKVESDMIVKKSVIRKEVKSTNEEETRKKRIMIFNLKNKIGKSDVDNNNNNNCLKSNIQCIEIRVQWTVHLGSSHMHVHAVTRVHAVTPKLVICVMYLTSI